MSVLYPSFTLTSNYRTSEKLYPKALRFFLFLLIGLISVQFSFSQNRTTSDAEMKEKMKKEASAVPQKPLTEEEYKLKMKAEMEANRIKSLSPEEQKLKEKSELRGIPYVFPEDRVQKNADQNSKISKPLPFPSVPVRNT